jgi:YihY family inner membrane protein
MELPPIATITTVMDIYGRAAGGLLASGLAFASLFAAIPTTLLVLGVAGWAASGDAVVQEQVTEALVRVLPPLENLIRSAVNAITDGAPLTSLIGAVGVVWTVSQLFGAVDTAFARIYSDERERGALWRMLRGVFVVGLLAAVVVGVIVGLGVVAAFDMARGLPDSAARRGLDLFLSPVAQVLIACVGVVLAYRFLPPNPPRWRPLLLPAVLVGVVLLVFSQVFAFLVPRLVGVAELAGPLASGFVALAWLSFSFQALLIGATWVRVRDDRLGVTARRPPSADGSAALQRPAAPAEPGGGGE